MPSRISRAPDLLAPRARDTRIVRQYAGPRPTHCLQCWKFCPCSPEKTSSEIPILTSSYINSIQKWVNRMCECVCWSNTATKPHAMKQNLEMLRYANAPLILFYEAIYYKSPSQMHYFTWNGPSDWYTHPPKLIQICIFPIPRTATMTKWILFSWKLHFDEMTMTYRPLWPKPHKAGLFRHCESHQNPAESLP